ncbi:DNA primase [Coralliovum pocilloporae]|uniref:DNA primase n=1 Tax=Coralliovum pocilloporae TaxID=3066369 RepID=UPI003306C014
MRFTPDILDEIRARLPVSEVVGRRVKLRRQGREFAGLSPFTNEKTPSFTVNDQKGFYHCFSSGQHGDIFTFLMETEGLSFPEAVERLADETGVRLPKVDPHAERREKQKASLIDIAEMACTFFQAQLRAPSAAPIRSYVQQRKLTSETVAEFRIGYAPDGRTALKEHLAGQGVSEADMIAVGLIIQPDDGRPTYDRFRNRLIIPIQDEKGRVVAFGGRTLDPDGKPKYLNSPETSLFHKGYLLFNAHRARQAAYEGGSVVVTEGYMDAIAVYQAGIKAVVATLGTAFTESQIGRLWRLSAEPVICFDGDRAGLGAAHRAVDRILPELKAGKSFNFALLPEGQDPDDLIQNGGLEAFRNQLERSIPLSDILWRREISVTPIDTPERKAALENRLNQLVNQIKDALVQRQYRMKYRIELSNLFWTTDRKASAPAVQEAAYSLPVPEKDKAIDIERIVLGLCVHYPNIYSDKIEDITLYEFKLDVHNAFAKGLYTLLIACDELSTAEIYQKLDPRFYAALGTLHGPRKVDDDGNVEVSGVMILRRFPILKFHPAQDFIVRSMDYFLSYLCVRDMEGDVERVLDECAKREPTPDDEQLLISLTRDIRRLREELARDEQELVEESGLIRKNYKGQPDTSNLMALAAN